MTSDGIMTLCKHILALAGHKPNAIPVADDTSWDSGYNCRKGVLYHQPCLLKLAQAGHLRFEDRNGVTTDLNPEKVEQLIIIKCNMHLQSFTFPFSEYLNDWTKSRKLLLLDYSIE